MDSKIDALLFPFSIPAMKHNMGANLLDTCSTTLVFNLFDLPAGCVPVTRVISSDLDFLPRKLADLIDRMADENDRNSEGLPVGIQIVGLPFQEEKVARVMKDIESFLPTVGQDGHGSSFDDLLQQRSNITHSLFSSAEKKEK